MARTATQITLKHINEKLKHIHKSIHQNSKDINQLKEQMAMGRGGLKVLIWVGGMLIASFAAFKGVMILK